MKKNILTDLFPLAVRAGSVAVKVSWTVIRERLLEENKKTGTWEESLEPRTVLLAFTLLHSTLMVTDVLQMFR